MRALYDEKYLNCQCDVYGSLSCINSNYFYELIGILTSSADVDVAKVESAQKTRYLDNKVRAMLREIVWQVIMFVLFTWVIVGPLDSNVYHQNQDIRNAFIEDAEVHVTVILYFPNRIHTAVG